MTELKAFDPAEYLGDDDALSAYLEDALPDSVGEFLEALGVVARAKGMTDLAASAGVTRPALYRSLKASGHPDFNTIARLLDSLGMSLHVTSPVKPKRKTGATKVEPRNQLETSHLRRQPTGATTITSPPPPAPRDSPMIRQALLALLLLAAGPALAQSELEGSPIHPSPLRIVPAPSLKPAAPPTPAADQPPARADTPAAASKLRKKRQP